MTDTKNRQDSQVTADSQSAGDAAEAVSISTLKLQHDLVKAMLPVGAFRTDDHRYYFNGEGPLPGATTVLELLDKPALTMWKQQQAAGAAFDVLNDGMLDPAQKTDRAEVVKLALAAVRKIRTDTAAVGSGVHHIADMALRASESDPEAWRVADGTQPYLDAFRDFSDRYERSSFVSSEKMVWSLNGYAGTYDLLLMIEGELWLLDIKTGKGLYEEFALQLAAYRWADSIILENHPLPYSMPNVDRTGILHLRPDDYPEGWALYEYETSYSSTYMAFLGLLEAYKWKESKQQAVRRST